MLDRGAVSYQVVLTKAEKIKTGGARTYTGRGARGAEEAPGGSSAGVRHVGRGWSWSFRTPCGNCAAGWCLVLTEYQHIAR